MAGGTLIWCAGSLLGLAVLFARFGWLYLFSTLIRPHAPIWMLATAARLVIVIEFTWYCIAAWVFSLSPVAAAYRRAKRSFDRLTGGLFLFLGVRLAASN